MAQPVPTYPEEFELAVQAAREEMDARIRLMEALEMFEMGKISSGQAAEMAGLSPEEFAAACGRRHVQIVNDPSDRPLAELQTDGKPVAQSSPAA
jgi:predicted HTH domain antitoxin